MTDQPISTASKKTLVTTPEVIGFFHGPTNTISYLVVDPETNQAVIIDPVLDFDPAAARTSTQAADELLEIIASRSLEVRLILETHIHADHLSAADYLKRRLGAEVAVGNQICNVQKAFSPLFNLPYPISVNGRQFDRLLQDGEKFEIGKLSATVIATPGHTPACLSFLIGDAVFVGDTLFMPDFGTARCDFPGGDAETLYESIQKILTLPPQTRIFLCHDYPPEGRLPAWETTVEAQKTSNIHMAGKTKVQFADLRRKRDSQLNMPALILPAIQLNMQAGALPPVEENGTAYLKIPLNAL